MSEVTLQKSADGEYKVVGELNFYTVHQALKKSNSLFVRDADVRLDLAGVTRSDSAGVALLIEWKRIAEKSSCAVQFDNVPEQMRAIAKFSGVDKVLAI
jgi:phospholipid transport system transporter-binding protein